MNTILSFIIKMFILFSAIFAFYQFTAVIEGTSGLIQGVLVLGACVLLIKSLSKFDSTLKTKRVKVSAPCRAMKENGCSSKLRIA